MGYISMPNKELKLKTGELHNVSDAILSNIDSAKTKFAKFSIEISECEDLNIDSMDR